MQSFTSYCLSAVLRNSACRPLVERRGPGLRCALTFQLSFVTLQLLMRMHVQVAPADVEFMRKHTSGYICVGMEGSTLDRLQLPLMVSSAENEEAMYTAFTVTVDARQGISTGISAADRALTLRALADPVTQAADLRKPGHICPLRRASNHSFI